MDKIKTEHEEQRELVRWFKKEHPKVRIFAIPNGGQRSLSTAAKLKAEGVSRGVPDLFIPKWLLWIEMKRIKGGILSDYQMGWHEYLIKCGHKIIVGYGFENAKEKIEMFKDNNNWENS